MELTILTDVGCDSKGELLFLNLQTPFIAFMNETQRMVHANEKKIFFILLL